MSVAALSILGPLAAAALVLLVRRLPAALALLGASVGLAGALVTLFRVAEGGRFAATLPGLPGMPLRLVAEPLSAVLVTIVGVVSTLVLVYAVGYMEDEAGRARFYAGMAFFAAAMQALVLAGDWVLLLAAWELIGLSSYLLIGFWYQRPGVGSAASRAFLYTRTADLGLYAAIFLLVSGTGTTEISRTLQAGGSTALLASLLLLLAAAGKSAQTPLQGWLQDAMAGPTPVSALLHSATLVAAGAILMIRVFPLLAEPALLVVGTLGGVTALVAGTIALAERDLKRLLAASTSGQYGLMLLAVGSGSPFAALVHLTAHSAMKSSLFLASGVFQHARGSAAFADLAGVGRERRWAFFGFAVAGLALAGVPPLSGFFSKDAILAATLDSPYWALFAPLGFAGAFLSAVYVARALGLLWRGEGSGGPLPGAGWMGAGMAPLVLLAASMGPALVPLARLVGGELPEDLLVGGVGVVLSAGGLALGWSLPAGGLLGPARGAAERGFRLGGGFDGLVARPMLALASACALFDDRVVHGAVGALGRGGLALARLANLVDDRVVHGAVGAVGRGGLALARLADLADERGIDGLIRALVRATRGLGERARTLQSGLVHRELLLAVAGSALFFVLLVVGFVGGV